MSKTALGFFALACAISGAAVASGAFNLTAGWAISVWAGASCGYAAGRLEDYWG